ncbi:hypothetical protein RHGRI_019055 [Rhododendron griersonianum]|uniref:Uncharacterized protein n=1 Tax=Rhododendron griersonianum TaxID=479676 RepID=A0AAV6JB49_9ERIC|nr:hypothetical protein RHGRI_019055 [Rhododendron griersonianum]
MRSPNTIINLTKNPLHHFANASLTSIMATSSSNSSASSRRNRICKCDEKPVLTPSWTDDNLSKGFL